MPLYYVSAIHGCSDPALGPEGYKSFYSLDAAVAFYRSLRCDRALDVSFYGT